MTPQHKVQTLVVLIIIFFMFLYLAFEKGL